MRRDLGSRGVARRGRDTAGQATSAVVGKIIVTPLPRAAGVPIASCKLLACVHDVHTLILFLRSVTALQPADLQSSWRNDQLVEYFPRSGGTAAARNGSTPACAWMSARRTRATTERPAPVRSHLGWLRRRSVGRLLAASTRCLYVQHLQRVSEPPGARRDGWAPTGLSGMGGQWKGSVAAPQRRAVASE
jgi:hypothetical protein